LHRLTNAFPSVSLGVAVAELDRFVLAGARAARNRRASHDAVRKKDVGFDGRITATIENLARLDVGDDDHEVISVFVVRTRDGTRHVR